MIRGTTPTLELNVDGIDLTAFKKIVVTLQQQGVVINRQTGDSGLSVSSNVISVHLTQEESLKFKANSDVEIQAKLLSEDGEVTATDIERVPVESILNEEVLS